MAFFVYIIWLKPEALPLATLAEILTSNSVGTQLFFLGCNRDNNHGSNFITKKKIFLVHQKRKLATIEINEFRIYSYLSIKRVYQLSIQGDIFEKKSSV